MPRSSPTGHGLRLGTLCVTTALSTLIWRDDRAYLRTEATPVPRGTLCCVIGSRELGESYVRIITVCGVVGDIHMAYIDPV